LPSAFAVDTIESTFSVTTAEGAVVSPDGTYIWVANYNGNRIEKWSTSNHLLQATVSTSGYVFSLAMAPDGSRVVAAAQDAKRLEIINTSTNAAVASLTTEASIRSVSISPDSTIAWAGLANGKIVKVSLTTNTILSTTLITSIANIEDIYASSNGSYLYILIGTNFLKINTSDLSVAATVATNVNGRFLAMSRDESIAYISSFTGSTIDKINVSSMTLANSVSGFNSPAQSVFSKDGSYLYVTNNGTSTVLKLRTSDNVIVRTISGLLSSLWHITIDPQGQYLYAMSTGNTVYKIGADGANVTPVLTLLANASVTYRSSTTISLNVSETGGDVTFLQNGKRIPACQKIRATSTTVNCQFKPSIHGNLIISARYLLNGQTFNAGSKSLGVVKRSNTR
jgi:DNA-binding beta-propeller fold protein YncE